MPGGRACSRRYSLHKLYINRAPSSVSQVGPDWSWPVDPSKYDRSSDLRPDEASALSYLVSRQRRCGHFPSWIQKSLLRLTIVIDAVMTAIDAPKQPRGGVLTVLILEMHQRQTAFWGWTQSEWLEILCASKETYERNHPTVIGDSRHFLVAGMYLLRVFDEFRKLGIIDRTALSCRIFGRWRVEGAIKRVVELIRSWGYGRSKAQEVQWAVCTALLANKSPHLEDLTVNLLEAERSATTVDSHRASIGVLSRALAGLGRPFRVTATTPVRGIHGMVSPPNGSSGWIDGAPPALCSPAVATGTIPTCSRRPGGSPGHIQIALRLTSGPANSRQSGWPWSAG